MPSFNKKPLFIDNTNSVWLDKLKSAVTGAYINDATVTFTLLDSDDQVVDSLEDEAMEYVAGSNGKYQGVIPDDTPLTEDATYTIEITATKSGEGIGVWSIERVAQVRGES